MAQTFTRAIVRKPGPNFIHGITSAALGIPDLSKALVQHDAYCNALEACGLKLIILDPDPAFPDAPFVEDTAVVFPECAIITRPGDPRRRGEETSISNVLSRYRSLEHIKYPGTLDGGDVLLIDKQFYVGLSERTNEVGAKQFMEIVGSYGYQTELIRIRDILHLKSGVNHLGGNLISIYDSWEHVEAFQKYNKILIGSEESYAANCLFINGIVIIPREFNDMLLKIQSSQLKYITLDMTEYQKMDGGLTCLSLRF